MWIVFRKITESTRDALQRFSTPILCALMAFVFLLLDVHGAKHPIFKSEFLFIRLFYECLCGIALFSSFSIFNERYQSTKSTRLGLFLLGFSVLGLHYFSIPARLFHSQGMFSFAPGTLFLSRFVFFFICYHLLVALAAFQKITEIKSFWQYNQYLFSNLITSLLFSLALFTGLGSALLAIDKLFGFHLSFNWYIDLAAFVFIVFNTIFFFINFPKDYSGFKEGADYKKWLRIFLQYILIPVVLIYMLILYAYIFKILMYHHYPKGWVCIPILVFSVLGTLSYLLAYPIRLNRNNRIVYVFTQYFFYSLLPLLSLYFISIILRIKSYGVTEDRYLVLVLGLWLLIISIYIISSRIDNIIFIPSSLLLILFFSAIGPWGMFQLSIRNQVNRLERNLKRNQLLVEGKLVPLKQAHISDADAASIYSILDFLNKRGAIDVINRWLSEEEQQKLAQAAENNDASAMQVVFSLPQIHNNEIEHDIYTLQEDEKTASLGEVNIKAYNRLKWFDTGLDIETDSTRFGLFLRDSLYLISSPTNKQAIRIDSFLNRMTAIIYGKQGSNQDGSISMIDLSQKTISLPQDSLLFQNDSLKILFRTISLYKEDSVFKLYHVSGHLLTK